MNTKLLKYLGDGGPKMAMSSHQLQLIRMCLYSIQEPLQLLISNTKFGVLVPSGNIRMDLRKEKDTLVR